MQAGPGQFPRAILVEREILNRATARTDAPEGDFDQPVAEQVPAGFDPICAPVIARGIACMEQGRKSEVHAGGLVKG